MFEQKRNSSVVHLRLPHSLIVAVVDYYLQVEGEEFEPTTLNNAIISTLKSFTMMLHDDGVLELMEDGEASKVVLQRIEKLTGRKQLTQATQLDEDLTNDSRYGTTNHTSNIRADNSHPVPLGELERSVLEISNVEARSSSEEIGELAGASQEDIGKARAALRELIGVTLDQLSQPHPELDPHIFAPDTTELPNASYTLEAIENQPAIDIDSIANADDQLVREARERNDSLMLKCLAVIYYNLPNHLWGTEQARGLAKRMKSRVIEAKGDN